MSGQIIEADLTWTGERFEPAVRVVVNDRGRIQRVLRSDESTGESVTHRLENRALLPGMINAHSHAFQRGLRGRGESFPESAGSFWTWREEMYRLVEAIDESSMYDLSRRAFEEMLRAGITTVGEFHYLHHDASGRGFTMDEVVLRAAADAGIRIVLLNAYYRTGGINKALGGGQQRFATESIDGYWSQMEHLRSVIDPPTQSLGVVAHSIRAASIEEITDLHAEAVRRHMPFHMHVEEQPLEISDCVHAYGRPPMALLNQHLDICPHMTAVHCTHTAAADMEAYLAAGGNVCICPLTEANLGDGLADVPSILRHEGRICLGTDSNARISFTEEMRLLEYGQRLIGQSRGVCRDQHGRVDRRLWSMATTNGAHALGIKAGAMRTGHAADFIALDLDAPALAGWDEDSLLASFILGTGNEAIAGACIGGHWRFGP